MSRITVTISDSLCAHAEALAADEGVTLEVFVGCAVAEKVAVLQAGSYLRQRAARANWDDFHAILAKVPDVEPEEYDRISPELAALIAQARNRK